MSYRTKQKEDHINNLVEYIKKNMAKGYNPDSLRWALISQGNSKMEVDKALAVAQKEIAKQAPQSSSQIEPQITLNTEDIQPSVQESQSFWKKLFS